MTPEQLDEIETYEPRYEPTTGRVRMRRFLDGVWVHISRLRSAERERDEAWAEAERLREIVEVNDQRLAAVWDEARAEVEQLTVELKRHKGVLGLVMRAAGVTTESAVAEFKEWLAVEAALKETP